MLSLRETAAGLTISYPPWLGLLLLVLAAVLAAYVIRGKAPAGKTFGVIAVVLICLLGGCHFLGYKTTLAEEGARVYSPMRHDARIAWPAVTGTTLEERASGRGGRSTYLVLHSTPGAQVEILVSGLSGEERVRLNEYLATRIGK